MVNLALFTISPLIFLVLCSVVTSKHLPPFVEKCHLKDPHVKLCFMKATNQIKEHFNNGIPEFGFPSMNPLVIPQISLDSGNNFFASFNNLQIYHLQQMKVQNVDFNLKENQFYLKVFFPNLRITGKYQIQGKIMFLQLNGEGPVEGNFTNVEARIKLVAHRYKKRNKEYLKFFTMEIDEIIPKPVLKFEGLFKNRPDLTEQTNKIVNENFDEIMIELKPAVDTAISQTVLGLLGPLFERFSIQELFPE